jgi:pyruvate carboxylase
MSYGEPELVALYGSLMREFPAQDELGVRESLEFIGRCTIQGRLYSLGEWPGLVEGDGEVEADLYRILNLWVFRKLDPFEHFDPACPNGCKYLRRAIRLIEPDVDAWIYLYNLPLQGEPHIEDGSWRNYSREHIDQTG